jgi:hypothetical protein
MKWGLIIRAMAIFALTVFVWAIAVGFMVKPITPSCQCSWQDKTINQRDARLQQGREV